MTNGKFVWTKTPFRAFEIINKKLTKAPALYLPSFSKVIKVVCDVSQVGIRGILSQEGYPIAYLNKKLNDSK